MPNFRDHLGPSLHAEQLWVSPADPGAIERKLRPAGRICAYEHCSTILSRWNRGTLCGPCEKEANTRRIEAERQLAADLEQMSHGTRAALMKHREAREAPCGVCKYAETQRRKQR